MSLISIFSVQGQERDKRGFVGIGIGPSFLVSYDQPGEPGVGLNLNLLNASYRIAGRIGVSLAWSGGAHIFESDVTYIDGGTYTTVPADVTVSYGTLMIGPMYSFKLSNGTALEIKPRIGRFFASYELSSIFLNSKEETRSLGYSIGITYRKPFADHWCVTLTGDYSSGKIVQAFSPKDNLNPLSLQAGIGFQFL